MKLNFDNPAHIKIYLLSEGIRINPLFFQHFNDSYLYNYFHYHKDNWTDAKLPNYILLPEEVCCGLKVDESSDWALTVRNNEFVILRKDKMITKVTLLKRPKFYDVELTRGVYGKNIGALSSPFALSFFINNTCFLWDKKLPCAFCGYQPTQKAVKSKYSLDPNLAVKLAKIAMKEMPERLRYIYFSGGTFKDFDYGFKELFGFVKAMKSSIKDQLPIKVMNFPPKDLKLIKQLKDSRADNINFSIEVANAKLFEDICPGKHKYYGYDGFIQASLEAAKYFRKKAFLNIVLGLDKKEDLIDFMRQMVKKGVMISLNVFYPAPYSRLQNRKRPSVDLIYDIVKEQQKIFKDYNMIPVVPGSYRHGLDFEAYRQMI